jgi:hypothetical protein
MPYTEATQWDISSKSKSDDFYAYYTQTERYFVVQIVNCHNVIFEWHPELPEELVHDSCSCEDLITAPSSTERLEGRFTLLAAAGCFVKYAHEHYSAEIFQWTCERYHFLHQTLTQPHIQDEMEMLEFTRVWMLNVLYKDHPLPYPPVTRFSAAECDMCSEHVDLMDKSYPDPSKPGFLIAMDSSDEEELDESTLDYDPAHHQMSLTYLFEDQRPIGAEGPDNGSAVSGDSDMEA